MSVPGFLPFRRCTTRAQALRSSNAGDRRSQENRRPVSLHARGAQGGRRRLPPQYRRGRPPLRRGGARGGGEDQHDSLRAARTSRDFLLQTYDRDMGYGTVVTLKEVDAPIRIHGRHLGGFRLAFTV
jgi:hypothetical protein